MLDMSESLCGHCRQIFSSQSLESFSGLDFDSLFGDDPLLYGQPISIINKLQPSQCSICEMIFMRHTTYIREEKFIEGEVDELKIRIYIKPVMPISHVKLIFSMGAQAFKESFTAYLISSSDDENTTPSEDVAAHIERQVDGSQVGRNRVLRIDDAQVNTSRDDIANESRGKEAPKQFNKPRRIKGTDWRASLYEGWQNILAAYLSCRLSAESDKLVAIAAVIEILSEPFEDTVVASLWRSRLIEELLWCRESYPEPSQKLFPKRWRAPNLELGSLELPDHALATTAMVSVP